MCELLSQNDPHFSFENFQIVLFFREITKRNKQPEKVRGFFPEKRYISLELKSFAIITIDAGHDDDELDMVANAFSVMELLINLFPK